jgi:hypothetical protein
MNITSIPNKFFAIVLFLVSIDMILFGPIGLYVSNISIRKLLFIISFCYVSYKTLTKKGIKKITLLYIIGLIVFLILYGLISPIINGFAISDSIAEFMPLIYLAFIMISVDVMPKENRDFFLDINMLLIGILAIAHILIYALLMIYGQIVAEALILFLSFGRETVTSIIVGFMPDGQIRVQWISSIILILGLVLSLGIRVIVYRNIYQLLITIAILCTYSRAFWICVLPLALYIFLVNSRQVTKFLTLILLVLACSVLLNIYGEVIFNRIFDLSKDSGGVRSLQISSHIRSFESNILWGTGFGSYSDYIRNSVSKFSYESVFTSLSFKLGVFGFIVFFIFIFFPVRNLNKVQMAFFFSFLICAGTNPYLINFVGMYVVFVFSLISKSNIQSLSKVTTQ